MIRTILSLLFICTVTLLHAQNKVLTHDDYDVWKTISDVQLSTKGKVIVSTITTRTKRGDGYIHMYNTQTKDALQVFNGYDSAISFDENFVIFMQKVPYETTRTEKKEKIKEKNKQKETLYIYDVASNSLYDSITRVKSFKLPKKASSYVVIEKFKNKKDSIKGDSLPAWKNDYAIVYHLKTKKQDTIFNIKNFVVPEEGNRFYYTTKSEKRKKKANGVFAYNVQQQKTKVIDTLLYHYKQLQVNKKGDQLAYVAERDSAKTDSVPLKLFLYQNGQTQLLVDNEVKHFGNNQTLSNNKKPFFSEDGKRLYYYSKIKSKHKKDTTLLKDEIPEVDVWSWNDEITQPRQKANAESLKEETKLRYYDISQKWHVLLQDDIIDDVYLSDQYAATYILGADRTPYAIETWKLPREMDYYVINRNTGEKRLLLKKATARMQLSYDGNYGIYFDNTTNDWISYDLKTLERRNLTQNISVSFENEDNDIPAPARPYTSAGVDKNGKILFHDKYDIWRLSLDGKSKPKNITKIGRKKKIRFRTRRVKDTVWLARYAGEQLLLVGFDERTKTEGIYLLSDSGKLTEKVPSDKFVLSGLQKAAQSNVHVYRKENFTNYSDLYVTTDNFKTSTKITNANPVQKEFKWGTSELVSWEAYDGTPLEGLLFKPDNFDPNKKYPMIVYFYERSSDGLNYFAMPQPSASTINRSYLVSNDYLLFVPDIVYNTGQPGDDAYNCVISGVEAMEKKGFIDSSRMALQGQSWGGYQVAYLITKTNKFRAAMAGAPVSNMTSAYGGIRWGSGLSRMFQYEQTQSRIGKNLWDGLDLYLKNSPLFNLPNVQTPLLIMHNDNDGAVPYYQGIELFMGMRRLQKPAWMLVYNNEAHNLRKMKNRQDLSIRMMQFFDHYLKDEPAPVWMTQGIPRSEKGINFGYELDEN